MSDRNVSADVDDPDVDDLLLAAWLGGELDAPADAAVARRLAADPAFAARADRMAEVADRLAPPVRVPAGFATRLGARLDELPPPGVPAQQGEVDELARARARRVRLPSLAAALVLVVGGVGVALTGPFGSQRGDDADTAALEQTLEADADAPGEVAFAPSVVDLLADRARSAEAADEAPVEAQQDAEDEALGALSAQDADVEAARTRAQPEVAALLGTGRDEGAELAATAEATLRRAAPFADGSAPDACLDTVAGGRPDDVAVVARVERAEIAGDALTVYAVVTAGASSPTLQGVELWFTDTCSVRLLLQQ